jgi:hypothetical protein
VRDTTPSVRTSVLAAGSIAIALSIPAAVSVPLPTNPLVAVSAIRLLDTAIGVGPSFDGFGLSLPLYFYGTAVPQGDSFHVVPYPAQINLEYPLISDIPGLSAIPYWPQSLKQSEEIGAGYLEQDIANQPAGEKMTIVGMSQGTEVAEIARADMAKNPTYVANADNYTFVLIGDPYQPNGGILARFTSWSDIPVLGDLFPFGRPGPSDSPFQTTVYQNQYDGFADFPEYFNVLAIANALAGMVFEHVFPGYVLESEESPNAVTTTVGNTTYVTFPQLLPLLAPLRLAASVIGAQRFVDAMDPILRVFVEMGYNRTADPSQVQEFSWTTPQAKVTEAMNELPAAFAQSWAIINGVTYTPTMPSPTVDATEPTTPVTAHPAQPVDTSPVAAALRQAVVNLTAILTNVTVPLAQLLHDISNQTSSQTSVQASAGNATNLAAKPTSTAPLTSSAASAVIPVANQPKSAPLAVPVQAATGQRRQQNTPDNTGSGSNGPTVTGATGAGSAGSDKHADSTSTAPKTHAVTTQRHRSTQSNNQSDASHNKPDHSSK